MAAPYETLKTRADFLACARARKIARDTMVVQARRRGEGGADAAVDPDTARVGFTCSKKVGNAVLRNRAKRRLREAARAVIPRHGRAGWDYVLIGRHDATVGRPFADLCEDLILALTKLHKTHQTDRPAS